MNQSLYARPHMECSPRILNVTGNQRAIDITHAQVNMRAARATRRHDLFTLRRLHGCRYGVMRCSRHGCLEVCRRSIRYARRVVLDGTVECRLRITRHGGFCAIYRTSPFARDSSTVQPLRQVFRAPRIQCPPARMCALWRYPRCYAPEMSRAAGTAP